MLGPLGLDGELLERLVPRGGRRPRLPERVRALQGGETVQAGGRALSLEHRGGHSPGHLWVVDATTNAVFPGDHLVVHGPTNPGIERDPSHPLGRRPVLADYQAGLQELVARGVPVVFPGHGPPITDVAGLVARRLERSSRRTEHVLGILRRHGEGTVLDVARRMYGNRVERDPFGFLADTCSRLDLLVADGRARARSGEDGFWYFGEGVS